MSARRSPALTARETASTARSPPNARDTPSSSRAAGLSASAPRAASARLARRVVARVERQLQVLLGVVLPELAHRRERGHDGVLQLAVDPLDLPDVDVLHGVAPAVHADRPARRVPDLDLAERGQ